MKTEKDTKLENNLYKNYTKKKNQHTHAPLPLKKLNHINYN